MPVDSPSHPRENGSMDLLGVLLRDVSRSFYLTLRILPVQIRIPIGVAYLLARAADTLSDTPGLPLQRRKHYLTLFRDHIQDQVSDPGWMGMLGREISQSQTGRTDLSMPGERKLLLLLPECMALMNQLEEGDRMRIRQVVMDLTAGMVKDLNLFSDGSSVAALDTLSDTDAYTYDVAGCVGPFWTRICMDHLPAFNEWNEKLRCEQGIHFGKALQWTNILRDVPRDLRNGRCYLPMEDLKQVGLKPEDLKSSESFWRWKPCFHRYLDLALDHYRIAWEYVQAIPGSEVRVRLACLWPQWIGLKTIHLLRRAVNPLDPNQSIKIARSEVYLVLLQTVSCLGSTSLLESTHRRLMSDAS